jgi:transcriptional regulator GlxA family with amidase domain
VIVGGPSHAPQSTPGLLAFIREASRASRRVASICTGAFVLGDAGILDGRRVTTHWLRARELQSRFPTVKMEGDRIFVVDGSVWTSAGMSSGIDLALGMLEQDHGADLTRKVAQQLVLYHRRGGQSQHSALLDMNPKSDRIQTALAYAPQQPQYAAVGGAAAARRIVRRSTASNSASELWERQAPPFPGCRSCIK